MGVSFSSRFNNTMHAGSILSYADNNALPFSAIGYKRQLPFPEDDQPNKYNRPSQHFSYPPLPHFFGRQERDFTSNGFSRQEEMDAASGLLALSSHALVFPSSPTAQYDSRRSYSSSPSTLRRGLDHREYTPRGSLSSVGLPLPSALASIENDTNSRGTLFTSRTLPPLPFLVPKNSPVLPSW